MFQQAAQRLVALGNIEIQVTKLLIVTGKEQCFLTAKQLREVGVELGAAILEQLGQNAAPPFTLAALAAQSSGKDPVLVATLFTGW